MRLEIDWGDGSVASVYDDGDPSRHGPLDLTAWLSSHDLGPATHTYAVVGSYVITATLTDIETFTQQLLVGTYPAPAPRKLLIGTSVAKYALDNPDLIIRGHAGAVALTTPGSATAS